MKHIAQSGKNAGKWVACTAQEGNCRLGNGTDTYDDDLFRARAWHKSQTGEDFNRIDNIPLPIVNEYKNLSDDDKNYAKALVTVELHQAAARQALRNAKTEAQKEKAQLYIQSAGEAAQKVQQIRLIEERKKDISNAIGII